MGNARSSLVHLARASTSMTPAQLASARRYTEISGHLTHVAIDGKYSAVLPYPIKHEHATYLRRGGLDVEIRPDSHTVVSWED
jgi:hypothetical protein